MPARILIVEDDAPSRELSRLLLASAGYPVIEAADGGAGLASTRSNRPDLVLCDLQMPVADGFTMLRMLRADPQLARTPVVALTAFNMPGDREAVLAAGFNGYLSKPIDPEDFALHVSAFLPLALRAPGMAAG
jgi:CheY-like chemotaxis protein